MTGHVLFKCLVKVTAAHPSTQDLSNHYIPYVLLQNEQKKYIIGLFLLLVPNIYFSYIVFYVLI